MQIYISPTESTPGLFSASPAFYNNNLVLEHLRRANYFLQQKQAAEELLSQAKKELNETRRWLGWNNITKRVLMLVLFTCLAVAAGFLAYFLTKVKPEIISLDIKIFLYLLPIQAVFSFFLFHFFMTMKAIFGTAAKKEEEKRNQKRYDEICANFQSAVNTDPSLREAAASYIWLFPDGKTTINEVYSIYKLIETGKVRNFSEALQYMDMMAHQNRMEYYGRQTMNYSRAAAASADRAADAIDIMLLT